MCQQASPWTPYGRLHYMEKTSRKTTKKKQKLNFNHFALAKCTRFPRTTILGMDDELSTTKPCPYLSPCVNSNALERINSAPHQSGSRNRLHVMCGAKTITWLFNCWNTKKKHQISQKNTQNIQWRCSFPSIIIILMEEKNIGASKYHPPFSIANKPPPVAGPQQHRRWGFQPSQHQLESQRWRWQQIQISHIFNEICIFLIESSRHIVWSKHWVYWFCGIHRNT